MNGFRDLCLTIRKTWGRGSGDFRFLAISYRQRAHSQYRLRVRRLWGKVAGR